MSESRARSGMRTLRGDVTRGYGHASTTLERARPRVSECMGLGSLFPGTLNVKLDEAYQMQNEIVLPRAEVNNVDELFLQRCRVGGLRCVLVRPYRDQPNPGWDSNPPNILEIMSERRLSDVLGLDSGSVVEVEVEGDDVWWFEGSSPTGAR